jgi:hypothetical protein
VLAALSLSLASAAQDIRSYASMSSFGGGFDDGSGGFDAFGEGPSAGAGAAGGADAGGDGASEGDASRLAFIKQCLFRLQLTDLKTSDVLEGARTLAVGSLVSVLDPEGVRNGADTALAAPTAHSWCQAVAVHAIRAALPGAAASSSSGGAGGRDSSTASGSASGPSSQGGAPASAPPAALDPQTLRLRSQWASDLFGVYLPHVAHAIHRRITEESARAPSGWETALVGEGLRLVGAAVAHLPDQHSNVVRMAQLMLPLAITGAAPPFRPHSPQLLEAVVKFLTRLSKEHADVFKQTLQALSTEAKQQLQNVLRASATGAPVGGALRGPGGAFGRPGVGLLRAPPPVPRTTPTR